MTPSHFGVEPTLWGYGLKVSHREVTDTHTQTHRFQALCGAEATMARATSDEAKPSIFQHIQQHPYHLYVLFIVTFVYLMNQLDRYACVLVCCVRHTGTPHTDGCCWCSQLCRGEDSVYRLPEHGLRPHFWSSFHCCVYSNGRDHFVLRRVQGLSSWVMLQLTAADGVCAQTGTAP